ncbi:MAG: MFS transporter [Actinobacteria bacterium]|nr:MFS transporter [Actinomycetota bacterium]
MNLQYNRRKIIQIIVIVAVGTFMGALDSSIVNISLPAISGYFSVTLTTVEWVVLSYLIIITSLLLAFGRLGDLYGHKKIYNIGFMVFTAGSLACALSPSIILLIASRALQAVGAGMLMSMGPAIITANTPPGDRGKSLGTIAVSVSVALIIGPVLGGFLTSYLGWQSIFYVNIPIGIGMSIWAARALPSTRPEGTVSFDFIGAALLFTALIAVIFPLSYADKIGWKNPYIIACFLTGIVLLAVFIIVEIRVKNPMLDLKLFKNRLFSMSNLSLMFNFIAQFCVTLIMPFYLIQLREFSPSKSGLILISAPLVVMMVAPLAGFISDKIDARYISSAGMFLASAGLFLLSTLNENTKIYIMVIYLAVVGLGIGFFQTPNNSAIMGSVSQNRRGLASAMIAAMRNLGMVLGVAVSGSVFSSRFNYLSQILTLQNISDLELKNQAFSGALKTTFIVAGIISSTAIFTSLIRGSLSPKNNNGN